MTIDREMKGSSAELGGQESERQGWVERKTQFQKESASRWTSLRSKKGHRKRTKRLGFIDTKSSPL